MAQASEETANDRFHIEPAGRLVLTGAMAGLYGFIQGAHTAYGEAGSRFLVENSHRLPKTKGGWYWYHKRKNWVCTKSAVDSGARRSMKYGLAAVSFFGVEAALDKARGTIDLFNTIGSALLCGTVYAKWYGLPPVPTRQLLKNGLLMGALFGLLQDGLIAVRGGSVWYLPFTGNNTTSTSIKKLAA